MVQIVWHQPENIEFANLTDEVERRRLTDLVLRGIQRGIERAQRELGIETGTGFVMAPASRSGAAEGARPEAVIETVPGGTGRSVPREAVTAPSQAGVPLERESKYLLTSGETGEE